MLGSEARRIAEGSNARGHVASDNTTRTDHCVIANSDARQHYCAAPDPYVTPDADRATKLQPEGPLSCIAWVVGGEDLSPWPDLGLVTNSDLYDIEGHAVEVQEHIRTETYIEAVVAVKRWPNHSALANRSEAFQQQFP